LEELHGFSDLTQYFLAVGNNPQVASLYDPLDPPVPGFPGAVLLSSTTVSWRTQSGAGPSRSIAYGVELPEAPPGGLPLRLVLDKRR